MVHDRRIARAQVGRKKRTKLRKYNEMLDRECMAHPWISHVPYLHATKGYRRVSKKRIAAQRKMAHILS